MENTVTAGSPRVGEPGCAIGIASLPNLRDLGGWPTADGGRVRAGLFYRSVDLSRLADADLDAFGALNIRTIYDLRTVAERDQAPDRLPDGAVYVSLDVLADAMRSAPATLTDVLADPALATKLLSNGRAVTMFEGAYRQIVASDSARAAYRQLYLELADPACRPALVHCLTGKDRTGWAAAALLLVLGVPDELVRADYLLTNAQLLPALQPKFDAFAARGGDPELLMPVFGVREQYLNAAIDEMHHRYGTIDDYFTTALGLTDTLVATLRAAFIER
ncbi:tyrosine-protein phosphatase [Luedemannella flava]|uniref:Tyrosine-protein phosphatase n=1 Tax=Luedemannella flava TaxID=349316 RepID=A0ABP4YUC0_9ACTN